MRVACNCFVQPCMHCGVDIRFPGSFSIDDISTSKSFVKTKYIQYPISIYALKRIFVRPAYKLRIVASVFAFRVQLVYTPSIVPLFIRFYLCCFYCNTQNRTLHRILNPLHCSTLNTKHQNLYTTELNLLT